MTVIDLQGLWKLRCIARGIEVDYPVPGDVHSALIAAGQIPDPYKSTNEFACRWVADEEWVASRTFHVEDVGDGKWDIDIDYLDTVADVLVNGKHVLSAENCFQRHKVSVAKVLHKGENVVEVHLHSNTKAANAKQAAQPFYVPYHAGNCPIPNGNMLRKPQCHFGWDWNLAIVPFGICGKFTLKPQQKYGLCEHPTISQKQNADGSIDVSVQVSWLYKVGQAISLHASLAGVEHRFSRIAEIAENQHSFTLHIDKPELWWPAGQGAQKLHDLTIVCNGVATVTRIGLRHIALLTDKDDTGSRFAFRVNGREMFCKGANWIPADALPSRATSALTRKLLQAAVDANMNMIRVWGGGYYEQDWFYDICDELGLLVWQDFQFSCNLYPSTDECIQLVRTEVQQQVQRLHHHACIALWCGDNELIGALTWFEHSRKNRDRYLVSYDRLNRTIETAAKSVDAAMNWWPSSPSPGVLDFGDAWHDDTKGDMHFWSVWHEGKNFEHYHDVKPRFCSEFGFQSFPSLRICKDFVETEEDLNISSPVMEHHQRNAGGNARIAETMFRNFRFPMDFGNFVYLSQVQQGLAMRMAVEYWRSLKPHCMGTLYWQLNDTWPVASWSGLDHGGGWKLLHHMAKRFYAPVLVTMRRAGDELIASAVHDVPTAVTSDIEVAAISLETGKMKTVFKDTVKLLGGGQEIIRLNRLHFAPQTLLFMQWTDENGLPQRNHFAAHPYKHVPLVNPQLTRTVLKADGSLNITVQSKELALYVSLESDIAGHFSDNAFDLWGGESRTVTFTPDTPSDLARARDTLVVRDLYSSSH
jgi:beta-mannosidase